MNAALGVNGLDLEGTFGESWCFWGYDVGQVSGIFQSLQIFNQQIVIFETIRAQCESHRDRERKTFWNANNQQCYSYL